MYDLLGSTPDAHLLASAAGAARHMVYQTVAHASSASLHFGLPPQLPEDDGKLTVVLDIDETLVHTEQIIGQNGGGLFSPVVGEHGDCFYINLQGIKLRVRKRPFLDEFLREAAKKYELIAFTAGAEEYATALIDRLDPDRTIFRHRLFRQHCIPFARGSNNFVKDLRLCNRPLHRVVLVDNNLHSFFHQVSNGIPIASFFNDLNDKALVGLHRFLECLHLEHDVRPILAKTFNLTESYIAHFAS